MFDELHEECGVFGVYQVEEAASLTYYGLPCTATPRTGGMRDCCQ